MKNNLTLSGIRVLDLGNRPSTAWCGRLFGDYGAEVIGIEPDHGHPLRSHAPFDEDGNSIPSRYFLANRRLSSKDNLDRLAHDADVIITHDRQLVERLADLNSRALICAVTPFGIDGALCQYPGNDLTVSASAGWAYVNGLQGREPLKGSGYQTSYQAGTFAFGTLVAALIEQRANDSDGQVIDISEREVLVSTAAPAPLRYQYSGFLWSRRSAVDVNEGPVPVQDGWFALTISRPAFWIKAMEILGLPDLAEDKDLQQAGLRHKYKDRFVDRVGEAMRKWKRMDLFNALGEQRVIAGPVLRMNELGENPQFLAREFFRAGGDGVRFPGPFARMSKTNWRTPETHRADQEISKQVDNFDESISVAVNPVRAGAKGKGPLAGFRGLVLTQAWAGTYATELLGLLGADIIQLETRGRLDSWRGTYQNPIPKRLQGVPTAQHAWNCSPLYNSVNLNKRCITVDLSEPDGVSIFRDLVVQADFVVENFSPRVMGNLGISYGELSELKADLILASMSAYGATGPWAQVPGIGGTIEPSSGMSALLGYKDEHPMNSGQMYPDPVAGLCGLAAIALALFHRDRTGEGQYIDLSMQEANFTFIGDAWLEYALTGNVRGPLGNSHSTFAPHAIYPAKGKDEWIAIAAETDSQWQTIVEVLGLDATADLARNEHRKANEAELDAMLATATCAWEKHELANILRERDVLVAAVLAPDEIAEDSDLRDRQHMVEVHHPETGPMWQSTLPARLSGTPAGVTRPAPLQGQHSEEIFLEFLNMDKDTYENLCARGITGKGPSSKSSIANQA